MLAATGALHRFLSAWVHYGPEVRACQLFISIDVIIKINDAPPSGVYNGGRGRVA